MPRPSHITVINFIISFRNYIAPNWIFQSFWLVRTEHTICLMQWNISYHLLLYDAWWGLRGGCRPHFFTISTDRSIEIGSFHISNRLIGLIPYSPCNMPQPPHTTVINFITSISISSQLRRYNARALFFLYFFCVICPNHRILLWYHLDSHIPLSTYCSSPILRVICPNHRILLWLTTPIIPISTLAQSPFLQNK